MQLVATELRPGNIILHNGQLHRVLTVTHITPGNWRGMVQCKLRNIKTGNQLEHRFRSEDRVEKATLDTQEMQYLYSDGSGHHFMNTETFDQLTLTDEVLGDALGYMLPDTVITVDFYESQPVGIELPNTVVLEVVETEPALRGATAAGGSKPAKLETGITVQVPMFVESGTKIIVDTRTGEYVSRA
ncbi:MAG: elongation factor P [Thermoanaerobaculaceae bacterium]|jgi:elongation factor P|nr:elongation factor P [Thermoanaerobaculaceae bacterium]